MARTRRAKKTRAANALTADNTPGTPGEGGTVTKVAAVRAALAEGAESPELGVTFIRDRFGIEVGKQHFSAIKSRERKLQGISRMRGAGGPGRGRRKAMVVVARLGAAAGRIELLTDLEAVKRLVEQHGAENVKRMVDLLD